LLSFKGTKNIELGSLGIEIDELLFSVETSLGIEASPERSEKTLWMDELFTMFTLPSETDEL
jgi:hypothetical protein